MCLIIIIIIFIIYNILYSTVVLDEEEEDDEIISIDDGPRKNKHHSKSKAKTITLINRLHPSSRQPGHTFDTRDDSVRWYKATKSNTDSLLISLEESAVATIYTVG